MRRHRGPGKKTLSISWHEFLLGSLHYLHPEVITLDFKRGRDIAIKLPWQEFHSGSDSEVGEIAPLLTHAEREREESVCGYDQKRRPKTRKIREGREEGEVRRLSSE